MINILCVKIQQSSVWVLRPDEDMYVYTYEHVNRLYKMCTKNITVPFKFHCYTDNSAGIDPDINIIDYVNHDTGNPVFDKLFLFSDYIDKILDKNPRVYFDLDIIIKQNIDHIVNDNVGDLTIIKAQWRELNGRKEFPLFWHQLNSSCMTWKSPKTKFIWNKFNEHIDMYTTKYQGMDAFLEYEIGDIRTFPLGNFYSHQYGIDFRINERDPADPNSVPGYRPSKQKELADQYPVVLLNGPIEAKQAFSKYTDYFS